MRKRAPTLTDKHGNPMTADCPGREIFNHITSRWSLLVLIALGNHPLRFHELRDRVEGVSEKMLSQTLRTLTRDGFIARSVLHSRPPQVTYRLTEMGQELSDHFNQLIEWMGRRVPDVLHAQSVYDKQSNT